jgi:hypothetical protein
MSGGRWDYSQYQMESCLYDVGHDPDIRKRFPDLAARLVDLAQVLGKVVRDLDWDLSDDSSIEDDKAFEKEALDKLSGCGSAGFPACSE